MLRARGCRRKTVKMSSLIFLDVDGVLHPLNERGLYNFAKINA